MTINGGSGVFSWHNEWNRLAAQSTPGIQPDKAVEIYQHSLLQENQRNERLLPSATISDVSANITQHEVEEQFHLMSRLQLQQYCHIKHIDISGISFTEILTKSIQHAKQGTPEPKPNSNIRSFSGTDIRR